MKTCPRGNYLGIVFFFFFASLGRERERERQTHLHGFWSFVKGEDRKEQSRTSPAKILPRHTECACELFELLSTENSKAK